MNVTCLNCGVVHNCKICPNCGEPALISKDEPIHPYKNTGLNLLFKVITLIIVLIFAYPIVYGRISGDNQSENSASIDYPVYEISEMIDELDKNALNASRKYKGEYVEIMGLLGVIDSNGKYISVKEENELSFLSRSIHCSITNSSQKDKIAEMESGDIITIRGKVTSVGEVLGYYIDIEEIK